jgi:hypothetical protein
VKKNFLAIIVVVLIALAGSTAWADTTDTLVSVTADYWMPAVDANITSTELAVIGTDINIIDDLGLGDSENIPALTASIDLPLFPEILLSYFAISGDGKKDITKNLTFKGVTYTVADNVSSSYDITQYEALLSFNIIDSDAGKFGLLIGAKYFEVETELKDNTTGITKSESVDGPVPVVGFVGGISLPAKFRIEAIARGLSLEVQDIDAKLYDIEAALHYDANRFLRASVGYRYFMINAEDTGTNDSVDMKFTGPFVGITGSF